MDQLYTVRFAECAARNPSAIAVSSSGNHLTFAQLHARSNQLAQYLSSLGVGSETLVAVCLERSLDLLIALLAVWKAGGAYLPLDRDYPTERLSYMLTDSQASILITETRFLSRFPSRDCEVLCLDDPLLRRDWEQSSAESPEPQVTSENLAYVIYTSGSTGKPKGVEITHRSLMNLCLAVSNAYRLRVGDRVLQFAPLSFDISVEEIFPAWLSGSTLVLRTEEAISSTARFLEFVARHKISVLNLPTAYWHELVEEFARTPLPPSVRLVVIGGEKASEAAYQRWKQLVSPSVKLINTYGPTETTVTATIFEADPTQDTLPIGRPISNTLTLVVDETMRPVELGGTGELYIGGLGLARGYRNESHLTASRFIPNPFWPAISSKRLYKTGDRVRLLANGNLEFVGRADQQIKIRGYRIEPVEIENALLAHPSIKEAVVVAREYPPGRKRLVAYIVSRPHCTCTTSELMTFLKDKLAPYMLPAVFVQLTALPMTPAGKIDRAALPEPDSARPDLDQELVLPQTLCEQQLAQIWREVLQINEIGTRDSFFDLGGDSLVASRVIARVRETFGVELPLLKLFEGQTIEAVAAELASLRDAPSQSRAAPLRPFPRGGPLPVSVIQEQLWVLHELNPESDAYNMATAFRLKGTLDLSALQRAFNEVLRRHESLRTSFEFNDHGLVQKIAPSLRLDLSVLNSTPQQSGDDQSEIRSLLEAEARRPFDLGEPPLIRASLLRLAEDDHALIVVIHHSVSDGWSLGILYTELADYYQAFARNASPPEPARLPLQYADFACWQREVMKEPFFLESELNYWKQQLAGAPQRVEFPSSGLSVNPPRRTASRCWAEFPNQTVQLARQLAQAHKVTPFMILFSALAITLHRWTRQNDLVIGTVVAGRNHVALENVIGCFMNFLPLRLQLTGNETGEQLLHKARQVVLEAQAHQDCPFAKVVEAVRPTRDENRNPLYNVALLWQNFPAHSFRLGNLRTEPMPVFSKDALLDLRFEAEEVGQQWVVCCEYSSGLFAPKVMAELLGSFSQCVARLAKAPALTLEELASGEARSSSWFDRLLPSRSRSQSKIFFSPPGSSSLSLRSPSAP